MHIISCGRLPFLLILIDTDQAVSTGSILEGSFTITEPAENLQAAPQHCTAGSTDAGQVNHWYTKWFSHLFSFRIASESLLRGVDVPNADEGIGAKRAWRSGTHRTA